MTIRIDQLPATTAPSIEHLLATMKDGITLSISVAQIGEALDVVSKNDTQTVSNKKLANTTVLDGIAFEYTSEGDGGFLAAFKHKTDTPATSDNLGGMTFGTINSISAELVYTEYGSVITDFAAKSGAFLWKTRQANVSAERMRLGGGLFMAGQADPGSGKMASGSFMVGGKPMSQAFLGEYTATNATELVVQLQAFIDAGYEDFEMEVIYMWPAVNGGAFYMTLSSNGGSSYFNTGYYYAGVASNSSGGNALSSQYGSNVTVFGITNGSQNAATSAVFGTMRFATQTTDAHFRCEWNIGWFSGSYVCHQASAGWRNIASGYVNCFKLTASNGNINVKIRLHGLRRS